MQQFLGNPESGLLNLEAHYLALVITKKTLDKTHFKTSQITMDRKPTSLKIGDRVYFKNKQPDKWDLKWRLGYRIVHMDILDIAYTLKIKLLEKQGHATSRM